MYQNSLYRQIVAFIVSKRVTLNLFHVLISGMLRTARVEEERIQLNLAFSLLYSNAPHHVIL